MNMDDVIAAIGRADYEIDQENTHGPIKDEIEVTYVDLTAAYILANA